MIGSLRGKLVEKQAPQVVIECSGVGYEVETPRSTVLELGPIGDDVFLHTHFVVREDAQTLYGFTSDSERQLLLLTVSRFNKCHYCVAAHSTVAGMQGVPADVVDAFRNDTAIGNPNLQSLREFAADMVSQRGWVAEDAGIKPQDVVVAINDRRIALSTDIWEPY